jgi:hypothetical protein
VIRVEIKVIRSLIDRKRLEIRRKIAEIPIVPPQAHLVVTSPFLRRSVFRVMNGFDLAMDDEEFRLHREGYNRILNYYIGRARFPKIVDNLQEQWHEFETLRDALRLRSQLLSQLEELHEELYQVQENLYRLQEELYQLEALRDAERVRRHGVAVEGETVPSNGPNQRIQNALQTHDLPPYESKDSLLMVRNYLPGQSYTEQGSDGAEAMLSWNNSSVSVATEDINIDPAMHIDGPIYMEDDGKFARETGVVKGNHTLSANSAKDTDVLLR